MSRTSATEFAAGLLLAASLLATEAPAQALYKYRDDNGHWVFTDRRPAVDEGVETIAIERAAAATVRLYQLETSDGRSFLALTNNFHAPVQIAFERISEINLATEVALKGNRIVPARTELRLLELEPLDPSRPVRAEFSYQYIYGQPGARHRAGLPYRLPYAQATRYRVSQSFPDRLTHVDLANRYAIDFEMPIGTGVHAARAGTVFEVASDFFESSEDAALASKANIVRILHSDGTIALYGHLNWNSIRVRPGDNVARGQYIADSGNTGFSTGPHLHFVVQRNGGGIVESLPIEFAASGNAPFTLRSGDEPVAY